MAKIPELDVVLDEIIELRYNQMYSTNNLVKYLMEKYDLKQSRSYELVREARKKVGDVYDKTNVSVAEDSINKMESLQMMAYKDGNYKLALEIQKELNKVLELSKSDVQIDLDKITINIIDSQK